MLGFVIGFVAVLTLAYIFDQRVRAAVSVLLERSRGWSLAQKEIADAIAAVRGRA